MGAGGYRFSDYWKLGLPLSVSVVIAGIPLIVLFWPPVPRRSREHIFVRTAQRPATRSRLRQRSSRSRTMLTRIFLFGLLSLGLFAGPSSVAHAQGAGSSKAQAAKKKQPMTNARAASAVTTGRDAKDKVCIQ
jgi:hypothetical protein